MSNKLNNKGQVGDTVTWVVATVIIVVLLIFFIFGASLLADAKKIKDVAKSSLDDEFLQKKDLILEKSMFTYFRIKDSKDQATIYSRLQKLEEAGAFTESPEEVKKEIGGRLK